MTDNPLIRLKSFGQSIWTDFIRRATTKSGELKRWIDQDGISGVTSNPSIFEKAIGGSHDYDEEIRSLAQQGKGIEEIYQAITVEDIQDAAELFRPVYDRLEGKDGFVSLEVSPRISYDTEATIAEARRLWAAAGRPNVMIKVPATREGIPAIRQLLSEGININITLLFGLPRYREVVEAYLSALESRVDRGQPINRIASVASFFLSRIDVMVDPALEKVIAEGGEKGRIAQEAHGQVAIASAKLAYQIFKEQFRSERFRKLAGQGARTQRLLWASTSTKNPSYSDVMYVDGLIGPETINTMPLETINAYRDHGNPAPRLETDVDKASEVMRTLPQIGVDIDDITQKLEADGVEKFKKSYDDLMKTLQEKRQAALQEPGGTDRQSFAAGKYQSVIDRRLDQMDQEHFLERLWQKDASIWTADEKVAEQIHNSLGWLHVAEKLEEGLAELEEFAREVAFAGFRHVVHLGMGGSSLTALVIDQVLTKGPRDLPLSVLDTTRPEAIRRLAENLPMKDTLFIVASKSGSTAEPRAYADFFFDQVEALKPGHAGENFVAITDPGTSLVDFAREHHYRKVFLNFPDIGGRYSALSYFGMVPAALMGVEPPRFLGQALRMQHACASCLRPTENPGLLLGVFLGELANAGRDKLTFVLPDRIAPLGMWLEQLIAESTGKDGRGILPVNQEPLGDPLVYGLDRVFASFTLRAAPDEAVEQKLADLEKAGHPIVRIMLEDPVEICQEFFRWEFATAVAGSIIGINPFDQPNVQESKENTNRLLEDVVQWGQLKTAEPAWKEDSLAVYGPVKANSVVEGVQSFLGQRHPEDYIALLVNLDETPEVSWAFQKLRTLLRDQTHLATTMGYGPRYLHSTGQYHKGGPNTGMFLMLTSDPEEDVQIPGRPYSFGEFQCAQALGDLMALEKHGRRAMRIDNSGDFEQAMARLMRWFDKNL